MSKARHWKGLKSKGITKEQCEIVKKHMQDGWTLLVACAKAKINAKGSLIVLEQNEDVRKLYEQQCKKRIFQSQLQAHVGDDTDKH